MPELQPRRPGHYWFHRPIPGAFIALLLVAVLLVGVVLVGPAYAHVRFTYSVEQRGPVGSDLDVFRAVADRTLSDPRGWSLGGGIEFQEVESAAHFRLILASPQVVEAAAPVCSATYSCRVGNEVLINDTRWAAGTASWTRLLGEYRRYVINHEVGHWLGLGHVDCPGPGRAAPVMQQQSISLQRCEANVWPLPGERRRAAELHGTEVVEGEDEDEGDGDADQGRLLARGDRGPEVTDWQEKLNEIRDQDVGVDAVFGPETEAATREFQRSEGLTADGIVGPRTRRAMEQVLERRAREDGEDREDQEEDLEDEEDQGEFPRPRGGVRLLFCEC